MQELDNINKLVEEKEEVMQGMYLTFRVGNGNFGIEIKYVTEIIKVLDVTFVPRTAGFIKGIINLRNTIVPVVDMSLRFGREEIEYTDRTCIVVLSLDDINVGLLVDEVREVLNINDEDLKPCSEGTRSDDVQNDFIKAIGVSGEEINQLLDINKVFDMEEDVLAS